MITLPSCDMRSPAPAPKKMSETAKAVPLSFTPIVPTRTSAAIAIAPSPIWTTARGPSRTATFGPISAAASIEIDMGKSRLPVSKRLGLEQRAVEERAPTEPFAALLPCQEAAEDDEAADDQERHQRKSERRDLVPVDRGRGDGLDPAPAAALEDPEHDQPERDRRECGAAVVQLRRLLGLGSALHATVDGQHCDHDHDLTDEDVAPAPGRRDVAADQRAGGDRRACGTADHPVGECAILALVIGCRQGGDSRDH